MVVITIDTTNDAFHPDPTSELQRILSALAKRLQTCNFSQPSLHVELGDINGNRIGRFTYRRVD